MAWDKTKNTPEQLREYYREYYKRKRKAKLDKERAEHPVYKVCPICNEKFIAKGNQKYCCEACSKLASKLKLKLFRESDSYKQSQEKYRQSEKYKETRKKYFQSEHGKEMRRKYYTSERGKETRKKYYLSDKGQEAVRRYWVKRKANGGLPLSQSPEQIPCN